MRNFIFWILLLSFSVHGFYGAKQNNLFESVTTIVSAGGVTSLTATVNSHHVVTGASAEEVRLPLLTTVANGREFSVYNDSSGTTTVKDSTGVTTIATLTNGQGVTIRVTNSGTGTYSTIFTSDVAGGGGGGDFLADGTVAMTGNFNIAGNNIVSAGQFSIVTNSNTNATFNTDGSLNLDGSDFVGPTSGPSGTLVIGTFPSGLTGIDNTLINSTATLLTSAGRLVLIGPGAGASNTSDNDLVAIGFNACNSADVNASSMMCIGMDAGELATGAFSIYQGSFAGNTVTTGNDNTVFGYQAMQSSAAGVSDNTNFGKRAGQTTTASLQSNFGSQAGRNNDGASVINIGPSAGEGGQGASTIVLSGNAAGATFNGLTSFSAANEMGVGGPNAFIADVYWGQGGVSASPSQVIHHITNAEGTDVSAGVAHFIIAPGIGTGLGDGGHFKVRTAPAGTTGSTLNTPVERLEISDDTDAFILFKNGYIATDEQLVSMTADNQSVTAGRSMMRVTSDSVTSTDRTMDLQNGTTDGQRLTIISDTPTNAWELQNTGNQCLTALFTSTDNAALSLIWNSTTACWHEPR